jgi:hypothetical protein
MQMWWQLLSVYALSDLFEPLVATVPAGLYVCICFGASGEYVKGSMYSIRGKSGLFRTWYGSSLTDLRAGDVCGVGSTYV